MPTFTSPLLLANSAVAVQLPSFVTGGPLRAFLWVATGLLLAVILSNIAKKGKNSNAGEVAMALAANTLRIAAFTAIVITTIGAFTALSTLDNVVGTIAGWLTVGALFVVAYIATLFIMRQLLAPPWWRLNAWEPSSAVSGFAIMDAVRWIMGDAKDLLASLKPLDRILVVAVLPLTVVNLMAAVGPRAALMVYFSALGIGYIALVVALFSANRIPRVLLTRLQDLRQVARRIATGDLSARVGYTIDGEYEELGQLVADINSMARSLQSREDENQALTQQLQNNLQFEQERASRDQLTQLRNHRYFQEALAAELYRCSRTGETTTIAIIDLDDFKAVNDNFGHQEGDAVLQRTARAFEETLRPYDLPARLGGEEFGVIFPSTTPEEAKMVMDRIMEVLRTAGPNGSIQTFSGGIASFPLHATDQSTLYQLADSSAYAAKLNGKKHTVVFDPQRVKSIGEDDRVNTRERDAQMRAARTLVQTVDTIEGFGNQHSENVGRISAKIATAMGYDDEFAQQMYLCGLLHDVGKLGLDQSVMQKSGRLTPEEFEMIKRHPDLSAQIVMNAGLGEIAAWVRHHHEHFDGSGYPLGLSGQDIPFGSRIVLVAEAFDVMTSDRPYRQAMSVAAACEELMRGAGSRFDPDIVMALHKLIKTGEVTASDYSMTPRGSTGAAPIGLPQFDVTDNTEAA